MWFFFFLNDGERWCGNLVEKHNRFCLTVLYRQISKWLKTSVECLSELFFSNMLFKYPMIVFHDVVSLSLIWQWNAWQELTKRNFPQHCKITWTSEQKKKHVCLTFYQTQHIELVQTSPMWWPYLCIISHNNYILLLSFGHF